jgi:RecA/RadA recombinase
MAKKATEANMFSFDDIVSTMQAIIKPTSIQHVTEKTSRERGFISTGIYVLNAAFSGDIYGGIANNRISVLGGASGVGKSFLCYNICREAQAAGYCIIYVDTEFSIELDQLPGYGIDIAPNKFMLLSNNVIEDLKISMTQLLDKLKEQKNAGKTLPKMLFVLDSVGQLGSRKEVEDALSGKEKADFTKAKALGSFFRIINADLGTLNIASVFTNHTYKTMDMFPQDKMKGGEALFYSASSIGFLSKAKLKEGDEDELDLGQSGIVVTCKMVKNRLAKPKKVKFEISFVSGCNPYVGLDFWLDEDTFDQVGIAKGKWDEKAGKFIPGGNRWYVHHLGTHVATANLFTPKVFTKEVLDSLRPIIKEYFKYKSITELNEINSRLEAAKGEITDKELYSDDISSEKLFGDDED